MKFLLILYTTVLAAWGLFTAALLWHWFGWAA
jgi:hypothetical protein